MRRDTLVLLALVAYVVMMTGCYGLPDSKKFEQLDGQLYVIEYMKDGDVFDAAVYRCDPGQVVCSTPVLDEKLKEQIISQDTWISGDTPEEDSGEVTKPLYMIKLRGARRAHAAAVTASSLKPYILDLNNLFLIDPVSAQPSKSLNLASPLPGTPSRFAVTSDGSYAVISNENGRAHPYVLIVDLNAWTIAANIDIPENANAYGVAITPDDKTAYIVTQSLTTAQDNIYVLDLGTRKFTTIIPLPKYSSLTDILLTPDGTEAYLNSTVGTLFQVPVIDTASNTQVLDAQLYYYTQATGLVGMTAPAYLAMHPDGTRVYYAPIDGGPIHVLDTATNTVTKLIQIPQGAAPIAATHPVFSPDGHFLFVMDGPAAMTVIDTITDSVFLTIPLGAAIANEAPGGRKAGFFFLPTP